MLPPPALGAGVQHSSTDLRAISARARQRLRRLGTWTLKSPQIAHARAYAAASRRERAYRALAWYLRCLPAGEELCVRAMAHGTLPAEVPLERQLDEVTLWLRCRNSSETKVRLHVCVREREGGRATACVGT